MTWVAVAVGGAAAVGAGATMYASSKAAGAQADAANQANQTQMAQYQQTRQDQLPWMNRGNAAGDRLSYLLGTGGTQGSSGGVVTSNDLIDTSSGDWKPNATLYSNDPSYRQAWDQVMGFNLQKYGVNPNLARNSDMDSWNRQMANAGFNIDDYNKSIQQSAQAPSNDPAYGSLLRNFTTADLNADPVYQSGLQFGLDQGTAGINHLAAANGGLDSGATLKALTRFGTDYGSTKAGDAYNRFMNNKSSAFNMLSGVSGTGQVATGQVQSAGQNMANNVSGNQIGVGNARAASSIGSANAFNGAIGAGINNYQQNQMMQAYQGRTNALGGAGGSSNYMMSDPYAGYKQSIGLA